MALLQAQLFEQAGIPVTFIAGDDGSLSPLDKSKIEFIALNDKTLLERKFLDRSFRGLYNLQARDAIERFIAARDTPNTIYHLHNWSQIFSPSVFHALRSVASRLFISAHDYGLVCPNLGYSNYQKNGAACMLKPLGAACLATHCDRRAYSHKLWRVMRSIALRLTLDLAQSRSVVGIIHPTMASWYERGGIPADRLRVVRNPVNPFSQDRVRAEDNDDLFFIGRVVFEKGVDLAAEAARLSGRRLRVIGDGEMRPALAKRYPELIWEGWRNHGEIATLIRQARAVIVPSRLPEAFTLVAHEALRSGVPVVAFSDVDGQEAANIGAAIVVPPREAESLAGAIRRLDDDALVAHMSRTAFAEGWRFSNTAETWRSVLLENYDELLSQSSLRQPGQTIAEQPADLVGRHGLSPG
jgi:glycosyltransferase involved in cell wall biosynthesis